MNAAQLNEKSLDRFLKFSSWKRGAETTIESAADSSSALQHWSLESEIESKRADIRTHLGRPSGGLPTDAPFVLKKPACIAAVLGRATCEQYAVLCEICDALRGDHGFKFVAPLEDEAPWNLAIGAARRVRQLSTHKLYSLDRFSRSHAVADACRRLEKRGYKVIVTTFGAVFESATLVAICNEIDIGIRRLGGRRVIDAILKWLYTNKRVYEGSLLYGRMVDQVPKPRDPSIPLHFLYNIALKHFSAVSSSRDFGRDFTDVAELARDMAAVFDVEAYSGFDGMTVSRASFHQSLSDRVVYDELFAFQQWQPRVASRLFSSWLRHLADQNCTFPLGSVDEWDAVGSSLIAKSELTSLIVTHPLEHTSQTITLSKAHEFFGALAIPVNQLNESYLVPIDTAKRNSPYYPIYKSSKDVFVLPPRGIAARALYERIYALLREASTPNLENRMGKALELLTAKAIALTGHNPAFVGAQYRLPGQAKKKAPYEVDVAGETDKRVFLFECKKKSLTNAARAGNTLTTAVDFSQAFLQPLVQMNGHEAQLRSGGITFLDGQVLKLKGRDIQRFAITMTDHGSMQDRMFLRAIVLGLWGAKLTSFDPALQTEADKVNEQLSKLAEGITAMAGQAGETLDKFARHYLRSSWWLAIDQLYFLCERAKDIWSAVSPLGGITFGTGDLMAEIAHCDRIGLLKRTRNP
jgi:hypothetical protein